MAEQIFEYVDAEYTEQQESEDAEAAQAAAERQAFEHDANYHLARAYSHPQDTGAKFSQWWLRRHAA